MEKYQTAERVRWCPKKKKVSRLDLFVLCVHGRQNGKRSNLFTF